MLRYCTVTVWLLGAESSIVTGTSVAPESPSLTLAPLTESTGSCRAETVPAEQRETMTRSRAAAAIGARRPLAEREFRHAPGGGHSSGMMVPYLLLMLERANSSGVGPTPPRLDCSHGGEGSRARTIIRQLSAGREG